MLNPDPCKRLGYKKYKDLINHPYFEGCFEENGKLINEKLQNAAFKIDNKIDLDQLNPIPYDILFRIDNINSNEQLDFNIQGFTHINQSVSKVSKD